MTSNIYIFKYPGFLNAHSIWMQHSTAHRILLKTVYKTNFQTIIHHVKETQNFPWFWILSSLQSSCLYHLMKIVMLWIKFICPYFHMETSLSSFSLPATDYGFIHNAINMLTTEHKANTNKVINYLLVS